MTIERAQSATVAGTAKSLKLL